MNGLPDEVREAQHDFARCFLSIDNGIFSVTAGSDEDGYCLIVSCSAEQLDALPAEHRGVRVKGRIGGPGRLCI